MNAVELVPKLLCAGLNGDRKMMEAATIMIIKKIRSDYPTVADELSHILAHSNSDYIVARAINLPPLPVDKESRYTLVDVEEPDSLLPPVLNDYTKQQISDFLKERNLMEQFIQAGITPPNSLLLSGPPGVGKTYIAHWISSQLRLPLVTLDLATSISSYLGRSGQNIRSIFDYAKAQPTVLLLDELDAIAKRRDDSGDLGELKRLVNVLLKEIEDYPVTCVLIGATNHPELLDKAIWRRFDRVLTVDMPGVPERSELLNIHLNDYKESIGEDILEYAATISKGVNAADICKLCEHIKRQFIISPDTPVRIVVLAELFKIMPVPSREEKKEICTALKEWFPAITQRDISNITRIPLASVSRYLSREKEEDQHG